MKEIECEVPTKWQIRDPGVLRGHCGRERAERWKKGVRKVEICSLNLIDWWQKEIWRIQRNLQLDGIVEYCVELVNYLSYCWYLSRMICMRDTSPSKLKLKPWPWVAIGTGLHTVSFMCQMFYLTKHRFELVSILIARDISRDNFKECTQRIF